MQCCQISLLTTTPSLLRRLGYPEQYRRPGSNILSDEANTYVEGMSDWLHDDTSSKYCVYNGTCMRWAQAFLDQLESSGTGIKRWPSNKEKGGLSWQSEEDRTVIRQVMVHLFINKLNSARTQIKKAKARTSLEKAIGEPRELIEKEKMLPGLLLPINESDSDNDNEAHILPARKRQRLTESKQASSVLHSRPRLLSVEIVPDPINQVVLIKSEDEEDELQQIVPSSFEVQERRPDFQKSASHHQEHQSNTPMSSDRGSTSASNSRSLSDQRRQSGFAASCGGYSALASPTGPTTALWIEFPNRKVLKMDMPWTLKYLSQITVSELFKEFSRRTAIEESEFDALELKAMFSDKQSVTIDRELPDEEFVDALDFCEIWMDDALRARERTTRFKFLIRIPRAEHAEME